MLLHSGYLVYGKAADKINAAILKFTWDSCSPGKGKNMYLCYLCSTSLHSGIAHSLGGTKNLVLLKADLQGAMSRIKTEFMHTLHYSISNLG